MKNNWLMFYSGIVTVKVSGKGLERFINTLVREGIDVWKVKRHGLQAMSFEMKLQDCFKLRKVVRNSDCKIEFQRRRGFPFLIKRVIKNSGFLIGTFVFILLITLLSNMVWGIEIKGANPATEYKIRKELDHIGVQKGKLQWLLGTPDSIQKRLTESLEEITWVGVELQGTTYHLQVVEKNEPEEKIQYGPQHLVAAKKATIVNYFVEEGKRVVEVNEVVKPGQVLVSGLIGKEGEEKLVASQGKIYGATWYTTNVVQPLATTMEVYTGKETNKYALKFGNYTLPIWGFKKHEYKEFVTEEDISSINFLKWTLPVSFAHTTNRESQIDTRLYTEKQAISVARELARKDIKKAISEDAKIKGEKVLRQMVKNGKVNLTVHFTVVENIAKTQPITKETQNDRES